MNIYRKVILGAVIAVIVYGLTLWRNSLSPIEKQPNRSISLAAPQIQIVPDELHELSNTPVERVPLPTVIKLPDTSVQAEQPQAKQAQNLTGVWRCNDGGLYFIRQVGNQVWWYGESGDGGVGWSNVFQGYVTAKKIIGKWADVPKGTARNYGEMTLSISRNSLRKISGGQNFTGSVWSH